MSIPSSLAKTNAETAENLATAAANTAFIANLDQTITEAIAQGAEWANTFVPPEVDLNAILAHYSPLGYSISFPNVEKPDLDPKRVIDNSLPFDYGYYGYGSPYPYSGIYFPRKLRRPDRLIISWK